jgi:hypothetical protein
VTDNGNLKVTPSRRPEPNETDPYDKDFADSLRPLLTGHYRRYPSPVQARWLRLLISFPGLRRFFRWLGEPYRPDLPHPKQIAAALALNLHSETAEPLAALLAEHLRPLWRADIQAALAAARKARR